MESRIGPISKGNNWRRKKQILVPKAYGGYTLIQDNVGIIESNAHYYHRRTIRDFVKIICGTHSYPLPGIQARSRCLGPVCGMPLFDTGLQTLGFAYASPERQS